MVRAVLCTANSRTVEQIVDMSKIRSQLNEQLRCLETRTEAQTAILLELNDYYRKKAELDGEYGKQLEKLAKNIMQKHKNERYKILLTFEKCWQNLTGTGSFVLVTTNLGAVQILLDKVDVTVEVASSKWNFNVK
ncbi:unnamed protein product [Acanthocheilonema viteae]|uniref:FCH domain-containing protein n=1 Tax=Acanthocheilonema viteae TaxID=6277 RepID=A0A498SA19_ACAVI|nr:unnamed protein product [Acanthocheilonema viteae]